MKIAGVSINKDKLIERELLVELALNTPKYFKKRNALEDINKEIDKSGLYRQDKPKSKKREVKRSKTDRRPNNIKQS